MAAGHDLETRWWKRMFSPWPLRDARYDPDSFSAGERGILWYEHGCKWITVICVIAMIAVPSFLVDLGAFFVTAVWLLDVVLLWFVGRSRLKAFAAFLGWTGFHVGSVFFSLAGGFFLWFPISTVLMLPLALPNLDIQDPGLSDLKVNGTERKLPRQKVKIGGDTYIAIGRDPGNRAFHRQPYRRLAEWQGDDFPYLATADPIPLTKELYVLVVVDD